MRHSALLSHSRARLVAACLAVASLGGCMTGRTQFLPPTRPAEFSLAGVPWGVRRDSVTSFIEPRGYNFNRTDNDGDMWFDGVLYGKPTRIYAFMASEQLVKLRVFISTPDDSALAVYQRARAELIRQYGVPKESVERYDAAYARGPKEKAIRAKKGVVLSYWIPKGSTRFVSVEVTPELAVIVDYDGPAWEREALRRRKSD